MNFISITLILMVLWEIEFIQNVYRLPFWSQIKYLIPYKPKYQYNFKFRCNEELDIKWMFLSVFHITMFSRTHVIVWNTHERLRKP